MQIVPIHEHWYSSDDTSISTAPFGASILVVSQVGGLCDHHSFVYAIVACYKHIQELSYEDPDWP